MAAKKQPLRQCVGCREMKPKKEMIRIVKPADEEICFDPTGRKNGRGAYICKDPDCLEKAYRSRGLEKSLKTKIPEALYESLREEMREK